LWILDLGMGYRPQTHFSLSCATGSAAASSLDAAASYFAPVLHHRFWFSFLQYTMHPGSNLCNHSPHPRYCIQDALLQLYLVPRDRASCYLPDGSIQQLGGALLLTQNPQTPNPKPQTSNPQQLGRALRRPPDSSREPPI
jgi:hypothetical protein